MSETLAQSFVRYIHEDLRQIKQPHFDIAFRLAEAKKFGYAEELGYKDIYELSEIEFGFKRSSTAAYISVAETYGIYTVNSSQAPGAWALFSFSQLVEMLPLSSYDRMCIRSDMTVKQIRKYKQDHKFVTLENGDYVMYGELTDKQKANYEEYRERKKAENKSVQTSGQENVETAVVNLQDFDKNLSAVSNGPVAKSSLLNLKNKSERENFLSEYKSWGVWLSVPELELTCYKYKFANGDELVVSESYYWTDPHYYHKNKHLKVRYHLLNKERQFFDLSGIAKTYVLEYMTNKSKEL